MKRPMLCRRTMKSLRGICAIARAIFCPDDYESGDAAWVTGHFKNLNAQIGSYETYDDELYGVKTFFRFQSAGDAATGNHGAAPGDEGSAGAGRFAALRSSQEDSRRHSGRRL